MGTIRMCMVCKKAPSLIILNGCEHDLVCLECLMKQRFLKRNFWCKICKKEFKDLLIASGRRRDEEFIRATLKRGGVFKFPEIGMSTNSCELEKRIREMMSAICHECNKTFESVEVLVEHQKERHGSTVCPLCANRSMFCYSCKMLTPIELEKHTKKSHKSDDHNHSKEFKKSQDVKRTSDMKERGEEYQTVTYDHVTPSNTKMGEETLPSYISQEQKARERLEDFPELNFVEENLYEEDPIENKENGLVQKMEEIELTAPIRNTQLTPQECSEVGLMDKDDVNEGNDDTKKGQVPSSTVVKRPETQNRIDPSFSRLQTSVEHQKTLQEGSGGASKSVSQCYFDDRKDQEKVKKELAERVVNYAKLVTQHHPKAESETPYIMTGHIMTLKEYVTLKEKALEDSRKKREWQLTALPWTTRPSQVMRKKFEGNSFNEYEEPLFPE
ncbi:hypothetical protein EIN_114220 [Entamoeba invadens IP1]|uniref:C2H2-type domain-containing protein n=1 Tax=Entamoeba invadens IP1 TaxID=370355 RepID=A0A0A1TY02_ENTIV|nr:hypothetical protein EIN_114220 [Entamoeba invadens IP1]ELP86278.1 hypothetical protein EIN_114220 [Entamoeba invadens IP1]|eukprot:XP_004185624.1 hypothetical protein EIN_114220 [Entamoeba invadens IP1]